jgi:hypothetical protein
MEMERCESEVVAKKRCVILDRATFLEKDYVATPLWPSVGVKPNTSKVEDLESSGTPECLELSNNAQNTSH